MRLPPPTFHPNHKPYGIVSEILTKQPYIRVPMTPFSGLMSWLQGFTALTMASTKDIGEERHRVKCVGRGMSFGVLFEHPPSSNLYMFNYPEAH